MIANWKQSVLAKFGIVALILLTVVLYFPPYADAWVGDDYIQFDFIEPFVQRPFTAFQLFNPYELTWYYRPLQNIWLLLNQLILGYTPHGYYLILLGFHAIVISFMYRIARQLKFSYFAAFICAGLFAIHAHWVDVVAWVSSVAIVMSGFFNLWGISVWLSYLKRPSRKYLLLTIFICILALWAHEEGLLLAPFLLLILIVERLEIRAEQSRTVGHLRWRDRRLTSPFISRQEIATFGFLALTSLVYLYTQLTRENVTIDITERSSNDWIGYLSLTSLQDFFQATLYRFTLFAPIQDLTGAAQFILIAFALVLLVIWLWFGNKIVRLGLLWTAVHLLFIYWALWINLPNLYAGRHIYVASIGLILAIGATVEQVTAVSQRTLKIKQTELPLAKTVIFLIVTVSILLHANGAYSTQQKWLASTREEKNTELQLKSMMPTIDGDQHFFSFRFPVAPDFTNAVIQVWYNTTLAPPGGSLGHLQAQGQATADFVVLDYSDGKVYNLMPELQAHVETIFLWATAYTDLIIKDDDTPQILSTDQSIQWRIVDDGIKRQFAIPMPLADERDAWVSRQFVSDIPENSALQTAVFPQPNAAYRIRIIRSNGQTETLFQLNPTDETSWQETTIPLNDYWNTSVIITLEVQGDKDTAVYWANPRFVID